MKKASQKSVVSHLMTCSALLLLASTPALALAGTSFLLGTTHVSAQTSSNPVADATSERSLTITKYQATDVNDHGPAGDGTAQPVARKALQGVEFTLQRVLPKSGAQLVDPTKDTAYTFDSNFSAQAATTDKNGKITWNLGTGTANDGIYLVTETNNSGAIDPTTGNAVTVAFPSQPFFVYIPQTQRGTANPGLIYDVNVMPKNVISNDLTPDKTANGSKGSSLMAGNNFSWELTTGIPNGLYTTAKSEIVTPVFDAAGNPVKNADGSQFTIATAEGQPIYFSAGTGPDGTAYPAQANYSLVDNLDKNLSYKEASLWVHNASGWTQLADADYTTTYDKTSNRVTIALTASGIKEIGLGAVTAKDGSKVSGPFDKISGHIITSVAPNWTGTVSNDFDVNYQIPGGKPQTDRTTPGTEPKYFDGGFDILKEDAADKTQLAGAVFMISDSQANVDASKFLATDGNVYSYTSSSALADNNDGTADDSTGSLPTGVKWLISTSDANGKAAFNGLPLKFTDGNSNNVLDLDAASMPAGGDSVQQDYYVVETIAPKGYELMKSAQKVTVTLGTHATNAVTVDDNKSTNLPFTGGAGNVILITVAIAAIGLGTAFVVMDKKRKKAAEGE
ncbi:SpaH/EbpB family LPXTG-anchored major pilin [Lactovum odontotermitis]